MNGRTIGGTVAPVLGLFAVFGGLAFIVNNCGCAPREYAPLPGYCYEEALLTAKYLACVDKSATREESRLCRLEVDRTCGLKVTR